MRSPTANIAFCGLVLCSSVFAFAQQSPAKPPELNVLRQFVGNWTSGVTSKPAVWDQKGTDFRAVSEATWILDGWFLQRIEVRRVVGDPGKVTKSLFLWSCDPGSRKYVAWAFQSSGTMASATGQWDSASNVFNLTAVDPPPDTSAKLTEQFLDANTINGNLTFIDNSGKTLLDMVWTRNRQTQSEGRETREQWNKIGPPNQPLPDELKKLKPLIGDWDFQITTGPLDDSEKWKKSEATMSIRSILDGRYLYVTTEHGKDHFIWVIGYDSDKKKYRRITFTNNAQIDEAVGEWNGEFDTIDWETVNERPGPRRRGQDYIGMDEIARQQGKEALAISIMEADSKGKLYQIFGGRSTRRK